MGKPMMPGAQVDGEEGEHRRQDPHDAVQAVDGDAQRGCAVRPLGGGPDRDADVGAREEQREPDEHERDHDDRDDVGRAERDRVDGDRRVERLRHRVAGQGERAGQEQGTGREQLGQSDRRDREDEPRRTREATDDHQLDERSEHEGGDEADSEPGPPAESDGAHGEQHGERRGHGTEVARSEVDHSVRAPHDGEAEREERAQPADDGALHEHAERHVECHAGDADDENGDCSRNQQPPGARRAFGHAVVVVTKSTTTRASSGPRSSWRKWPPPSIVVCGCPWRRGCARAGRGRRRR